MHTTTLRMAAALLALALALAPALAGEAATAVEAVPQAPFLRAAARQAVVSARVPPEFNINSGGPAIGRFVSEDPTWLVGMTATFAVDGAQIGGAEDKNRPMYASHRFGPAATAWGYHIPVMEPGTYACSAHFAETYSGGFAPGARVFDLVFATAHGEPVRFSDVDVFAELGGAEFTVLTKTAMDLVVPGLLAVRVAPSAGNAFLSGLTCERTGNLPAGVEPDWETDPNVPTDVAEDTGEGVEPSGGVSIIGTEINVNAGGPELGRFLAEDHRWIRGATSFFGGPDGVEIGGAEDKNRPALISHRYGQKNAAWGYAIPVDTSGEYHCSLHFAETDSASFSVGARVFHIVIQGRIMANVDVFRDAGEAPFTSVVKTFLNLPVYDELLIALVPVRGDAFLSAITCERAGELSEEDLAALSASPEPVVEVTPSP